MNREELKKRNLRIEASNIEQTGCTVESVSELIIVRLHIFLGTLGVACRDRTAVILPNGLTSGRHRAVWHDVGLAADLWVSNNRRPSRVLAAAIASEFRGFGWYTSKNGIHSYHLDLRPGYAFWKRTPSGQYLALIG